MRKFGKVWNLFLANPAHRCRRQERKDNCSVCSSHTPFLNRVAHDSHFENVTWQGCNAGVGVPGPPFGPWPELCGVMAELLPCGMTGGQLWQVWVSGIVGLCLAPHFCSPSGSPYLLFSHCIILDVVVRGDLDQSRKQSICSFGTMDHDQPTSQIKWVWSWHFIQYYKATKHNWHSLSLHALEA